MLFLSKVRLCLNFPRLHRCDCLVFFSFARSLYISTSRNLQNFGYDFYLFKTKIVLTGFYQVDTEFGRQHGCKPPALVLAYKWPLALDIVKKGFIAGRQKKLLALFTEYFEQLGGSTVELTILGGTGFATKEPENIEALLSTQFDGTWVTKKTFRYQVDIYQKPNLIFKSL